MTEVLQQDGPAQRLASEGVGWLTTAGADGQPDLATLVIGVLIYADAFGSTGRAATARLSYAIAEGVTLFVFLVGFTALMLRLLGWREEAIH